MIKKISQFFDNKLGISTKKIDQEFDHEKKLQLATAALLIEIARADFDIADEEKHSISQSLQQTFNLAESELDEIMDLAEQEVHEAVSLHQFTRLIHDNYSAEDKKEIIKMLWIVAYSDNVLDKYEEAMIRKISDLLYVSHGDFTHAKSLAREIKND